MVFLLLYTSCTVPKKSLEQELEAHLIQITALNIQEVVEQFEAIEQEIWHAVEQESMTEYLEQAYGMDQALLAEYGQLFDGQISDNYFQVLEEEKMLSKDQSRILEAFYLEVDQLNDYTSFLAVLDEARTSVESNQGLHQLERSSLLVIFQLMEQIAPSEDAAITQRNACLDCIEDNKWKILGFGLIWALAILLACMAITGGSGSVACLIAAGLAGIVIEICHFCGWQYGGPCRNISCYF